MASLPMPEPHRLDQDQDRAAAATTRITGNAWWTLCMMFLVYFFSLMNRYIFAMLVPHAKTSLGLSDFQIGLVMGPAFAAIYALSGLPLGWAADRYSRRIIIAAGVLLFGVATALAGVAEGFISLFLFRMLVGIGQASPDAAVNSLLADNFPRRRLAFAISVSTVGIKMGSAGAYAIGGLGIAAAAGVAAAVPALHDVEPWRMVMFAAGAPALLLAPLVLTCREPRHTIAASVPHTQADTRNLLAFMRSEARLIVPLLIGFSLISMCSQALTSWVPSFMTRHFHASPASFGPTLAAVSMAAALTLPLKGAAIDWLYGRGMLDAHVRLYTWLLTAMIPIAAITFYMPSPLLCMILLAAILIVAIPIAAYWGSAMQLISPYHLRSQMAAVMACTTALLGSLGPVIVATLTDFVFRDEARLGDALAVLLTATFPAALIALRYSLRPLRERVGEMDVRVSG